MEFLKKKILSSSCSWDVLVSRDFFITTFWEFYLAVDCLLSLFHLCLGRSCDNIIMRWMSKRNGDGGLLSTHKESWNCFCNENFPNWNSILLSQRWYLFLREIHSGLFVPEINSSSWEITYCWYFRGCNRVLQLVLMGIFSPQRQWGRFQFIRLKLTNNFPHYAGSLIGVVTEKCLEENGRNSSEIKRVWEKQYHLTRTVYLVGEDVCVWKDRKWGAPCGGRKKHHFVYFHNANDVKP